MCATPIEKLTTIQKREKLNEVYVDPAIKYGANHTYVIRPKITPTQDAVDADDIENADTVIRFQCGPRHDPNSTTGVIDGDLLEIVRHRLTNFAKNYPECKENEKALEHVELALMYLNRRVEDRIERQVVLGTMEK